MKPGGNPLAPHKQAQHFSKREFTERCKEIGSQELKKFFLFCFGSLWCLGGFF
jgi:hypothetical protein